MKKKIKYSLGLALSSLMAPVIAISCASNASKEPTPLLSNNKKLDYDLGLSAPSLNSLNYVLYKSVDLIVPSLVDTVYKFGPVSELQAILGKTPLTFGVYGNNNNSVSLEKYVNSPDLENNNYQSDRSYPFDNFGIDVGAGSFQALSARGGRGLFTPNARVITYTITLNDGRSRWSNGDVQTVDDFLDYIHYIADINTGSQKQIDLLSRDIKGLDQFVSLQNEYLKKFGTTYKNPWGYPPYEKVNGKWQYKVDARDENGNQLSNKDYLWPSQNEGDEQDVEKIQQAALNVGFWSGRLFFNISNKDLYNLLKLEDNKDVDPSDGDTITLKDEDGNDLVLRRNPYIDPRQVFQYARIDSSNFQSYEESRLIGKYIIFARDEHEFRVEYAESNPKSIDDMINDLNRNWLSINRAFVENELGGIQNFGKDKRSILTNGPFLIDSLILGSQGSLTLAKNQSYFNVNRTISNKIKIYFNDERNLESAMFSDGYIAFAKIPSVLQKKFWADPEFRNLMSKTTGYGTLGFMFNLDQETNKDSYINDPDLRNAFYYAINREVMLFNSGWNNSYPVITWTGFGNAHKSDGTAIEFGFQDQWTTPKGSYATDQKVPLQNYSYGDHLSKNYKFEATNRTDQGYRPEVAKHYMEVFKAKHPGLKQVNLTYIFNSTEEQRNVGLVLKNSLELLFGNFINLELKALPENVYISKVEEGDFDIAYKNFDSFGTEIDSYVKAFFVEDGINRENSKTTGFNLNPSGGFTYKKYFDSLADSKDLVNGSLVAKTEEETRERLRVSQEIWDKIKELSQRRDDEDEFQYKDRYSNFFSYQFTDKEKTQGYDENKVIEIVAGLEKIIRDAAPVIPLMEVDTLWNISRVGGTRNLFRYDLQYAYDIDRPPVPGLPRVTAGQSS